MNLAISSARSALILSYSSEELYYIDIVERDEGMLR